VRGWLATRLTTDPPIHRQCRVCKLARCTIIGSKIHGNDGWFDYAQLLSSCSSIQCMCVFLSIFDANSRTEVAKSEKHLLAKLCYTLPWSTRVHAPSLTQSSLTPKYLLQSTLITLINIRNVGNSQSIQTSDQHILMTRRRTVLRVDFDGGHALFAVELDELHHAGVALPWTTPSSHAVTELMCLGTTSITRGQRPNNITRSNADRWLTSTLFAALKKESRSSVGVPSSSTMRVVGGGPDTEAGEPG
jgi:hypothetical protein